MNATAAGRIGGLRSGITATVIAAAAVLWFLVAPEHSFVKRPGIYLPAVILLAMGVLFALFHDRMRKANARIADMLAASERARDSLDKAVRERRLFAALIENSSDFIGIADPDGKPIYVNPAGRRMVGMTADQRTVISAVERCAQILKQLRSLGVSVAIDDFGTGYSSLSRLKSLPVDVLKIDRSFIRNIPQDADDRAIASAIISLGHELGMKIVAEGVETPQQLDFLRAQRCDAAQGFLICRPLGAAAMTKFLLAQGSAVVA